MEKWIQRAAYIIVAAELGGSALVACSSSHKPTIDRSLPEPVCHGTNAERLDRDSFKLIPILSGRFVDPNNVRIFLFPGHDSAASTTPASPGSVPELPQTGGSLNAEPGTAYVVGIQASPQQPQRLVMLDYQRMKAPDPDNMDSFSPNVPKISCPPINLGSIALHK